MQTLEDARTYLFDQKVKTKLLETKHREICGEIEKIGFQIQNSKQKLAYFHIAEKILQEVVEKTSQENLRKIEAFVNRALFLIFPDLNLTFKIEQDVKRGNNVYNFIVVENQVEGDKNSFGGGVIATISVVLKVLFNIITKRFPLLVLDESLSFLHSPEYISRASTFLSTLSKEFNIPILMVTQEDQFAQDVDFCYRIESEHNESVLKPI